MPSLLSRFKRRSSSNSSLASDASDTRQRRFSTASSSLSADPTFDPSDSPSASPNKSPRGAKAGSHFVEDFDGDVGPVPSPSKRTTRSRERTPHLQQGTLSVPGSAVRGLGTPKLVLTEEGSDTPRSVNDSPSTSGRSPIVGLGLSHTSDDDDSLNTPTTSTTNGAPGSPNMSTTTSAQIAPPLPPDALSIASAPPMKRSESGQSASKHLKEGRSNSIHVDATHARSRSGSTVSRLANKLQHSPNTSATLLPPETRKGSGSKSKKGRRQSNSSGVAAALAKSGLHIANANNLHDDILSTKSGTTKGQGRSPYLVGRRDNHEEDEALSLDGSEFDDEDEDDDSDQDDHRLPVTGFAVASNRRNAEFHSTFPKIDEGDYLIDDYGCALNKDILVQGRLFISENHLSFHSNILGWTTNLILAFENVKRIEKKMTALVIPNAIGITMSDGKSYVFASFLSRDSVFDVMMNIWRLCNPNAVMSSATLAQVASSPGSEAGEDDDEDTKAGGASGKSVKKTQCACGKEGKHYSETALDTKFPSTPEKIYNLMFTSDWFKTFLSDSQKLRDIETSDWKPKAPGDKNLTRSMSYIKPLNGSIGPKQTKCHIVDETEHYDFDDYVTLVTTTRTPDVPSGGVFSVKTRTCLMWAGSNSTKVIVTTTVEWTGKSWVKGIIEKSAIDGQKDYHQALESGMRDYIKEHQSEFGAPDEAEAAEEADEDKSAAPTEASEYAARTRRERQEKDYTYLSGAIDMVVSGLGTIASGLKTAFDSIGDLISDGPVSKEVILGAIIGFLVISNIWTIIAYRSTDKVEARRARRLSRMGGDAEEMAEAMRLFLQSANGANVVGKPKSSPREEVADLTRILDEVESRARRLRQGLGSAVGGERLEL